jgi:hypothetical protein
MMTARLGRLAARDTYRLDAFDCVPCDSASSTPGYGDVSTSLRCTSEVFTPHRIHDALLVPKRENVLSSSFEESHPHPSRFPARPQTQLRDGVSRYLTSINVISLCRTSPAQSLADRPPENSGISTASSPKANTTPGGDFEEVVD